MSYTIELRADIPLNFPPEGSKELQDAYGVETHEEAAALEQAWLNGEDGQGDYLYMLVENSSDAITAVVRKDQDA